MNTTNVALKILKYTISPSDAITDLYKAVERSVQQTQDIAATGDIEKIEQVEVKQEFEMRMAERQAKVAQELAIADRIRSAEEVEIEEFYDYSGEGNVGLNIKEDGTVLGAGGKGSRIVKRICRFKGIREITSQEIDILTEKISERDFL
jgi:hypothetical protein